MQWKRVQGLAGDLSSSLIFSLLSMVKGRKETVLLSSPRSGPLSLRQHPTNLSSPYTGRDQVSIQLSGTLEVNSDTAETCVYPLIHPGKTQCTTMTEMYSSTAVIPSGCGGQICQ